MQDDNSMVEKILTDLENIFYTDDNLKQFDILPIVENDRNKSPVLYEEHNLGLEIWCIKYVYSYIHSYLLKIRKQLKKNLSQPEVKKINQLLIGAVLIQPDVTTFWNMRRDLIEMNLLKHDRELLLTKLVLSRKSKSNEAFSHRRWVVKKMLKDSYLYNIEAVIDRELLVAKMASQKVQNNYHAWTHRICIIDSNPDVRLKFVIIKKEFMSSLEWVFFNVSEHSGFHYRQRLLTYLKQYSSSGDNYFTTFKSFILDYFQIIPRTLDSILQHFLSDTSSKFKEFYNCYLSVLLYELIHTCQELNKSYPGHESIWYHRRFVLHTILKTIYEYFNLNWQQDVRIKDVNLSKDENIVKSSLCDSNSCIKLLENGEKYPKLFKAEPSVVKNTFLYKFLLKIEADVINTNCESTNSVTQIQLAKKHHNWLKFILNIDLCNVK